MDEYSYRGALGSLWNYQSCGVRAGAGDYQALAAELRAIESLARSKGLGPTLERVREEYDRLLAVSTIMPCAGGPAAALARARPAIAAFRAWVEQAPVHRLSQAEVDDAASREVLAAEDGYIAAVAEGDEAAIRLVLADGFLFDPGDGAATTGADGLLEALHRLNLIHYRMKDRTVAMQNGVGTVSGTLELASASPREAVIRHFPYHATYERRAGVWRMLALRLSAEAR